MTDIANEIAPIASAAEAIAPNAPIVEMGEAIFRTAIDPSPANFVADMELAISLIKQLKASLAGAHPSVLELIKLLF